MIRNSFISSAIALVLAATAPAIAQDESARVTEGNLVKEGIPEIPAEISAQRRRYSNFRGHGFRDWAGDGIYIGTRFGEVTQVHQVAQPLGMRRQITFYDEPVGGANADPDGDGFVFAKRYGRG